MSDPSQAPAKRLKSSANTSTSSPAQTTSHSDPFMPTYPYHAGAYTNNPTAFTYQSQGYVPQHQLPQIPQTLQPSHNQVPQHISPPLPLKSRKRRSSEIEDEPLPTSRNLGGYQLGPIHQQGMMTAQSGHGTSYLSPSGSHSKSDLTSSGGQTGEMPSPTQPKKGRTNTPWTPAEEQRLKRMRDEQHSWAEIAKAFPNRTEGSVKKHWYKDMHYAEFTEEDGSFGPTLASAIKDWEAQKWKTIGQKVGKPAKVCEQYAREHLGKT